ncbi:unnamed protein product [Pleuronectes platessa]|uniref:Uncharacterized protein n=1 Tax=Pleuronectes platessa TaxID=8262 RepID=A0A9N7UXC5_PLEPL|nr:unnamed protein product [Pleuronectes platessa]
MEGNFTSVVQVHLNLQNHDPSLPRNNFHATCHGERVTKTLDSFFFRSRGRPLVQPQAKRRASPASRPSRGLDDEAEPELVSADVSASDVSASDVSMSDISTSDVSPSEQPAASRDGKHPSSGFNPKTSGTGCLCITINGPSMADLDYSKALEEFFQKPRRITCKK